MSKLKSVAIAVAGVLIVAFVVSVFGGSFATASLSGSVAKKAVPVPTCTKPSNSPSHQQQVNYAQCLHQREFAQLQNMEERLRGPVPTVTSTVTVPGPTATETVTVPGPTVTETVTVTPNPTTPPPTTPTDPPPTTPPATGFPNAANTGVPEGVTLQPYTGPCIIQSAVTVDAKDVKAKCGEVILRTTAPVTFTRSRLPRVENTNSSALSSMVTISESNVEAGAWFDGAIWGWNFNVSKSEITGGQHNVHANENVTVTDSWLHAQYNPAGGSYHTNAFITNGGSRFTLKRNTLHCDSTLNNTDGGCTGDVTLLGDFDPVSDVLVEGNLLKANNSSISYCARGGHNPGKPYPDSTQIRYINNVFERGANRKCGVFGPVTSFDPSAAGNVWSGNVWDSGEPVPSAD